MSILIYTIIILSLLNLLRMSFYLIASNLQSLFASIRTIKMKRETSRKRDYLPTVTVLIPAHNEERYIAQTLDSVINSVYPASKLSVIVINDGSTDDTAKKVKQFIKAYSGSIAVRLLNQKNKGKAAALNRALKSQVHSTLVFCLDADSQVTPRTIRNMVQHFRDQSVVAGSSNVTIVENGSILSLAQRFEYLVCYQMKRAETLCSIEYIIGGIGSMFRTAAVKKVGLYDTNTQTEDIDLTLKLIDTHGNKNTRFIHAADAITYTHPALTMQSLMAQRLRWKYGRWQTFLKHAHLFFSKNERYEKRLTWFVMPYALFQELLFLLEPLVVAVIGYVVIRVGDTTTFMNAFLIITVYMLMNVWSAENTSVKERLRLSYYAPAMYFLLYLLSIAEYAALVVGLTRIGRLKQSIKQKHTTWVSPKRSLTEVANS